MPWGRLDDALHQNGKVLSFSDKAFRVWLYSISFCNAKYYRDESGALSADEAAALCRLAGAPRGVIEELVAKRGWDRAEPGYVVHDFPEYGPFLDPTGAERQRRYRNKRRGRAATVTDTVTDNGDVTRDVTRDVTAPIPIPSPIPNAMPTTTPRTHPSDKKGKVVEGGSGGERAAGAAGSTGPPVEPGEPLDAPRASEIEARPPAPNWVDSFRRVAR